MEMEHRQKAATATEDAAQPPEGIAPDIWEAMTPEERKLWEN